MTNMWSMVQESAQELLAQFSDRSLIFWLFKSVLISSCLQGSASWRKY